MLIWDSNDDVILPRSKLAIVFAPRSVFIDDKITSGENFMSSLLFEFTGYGTHGQERYGEVFFHDLYALNHNTLDPLAYGLVDPFGDVIYTETI